MSKQSIKSETVKPKPEFATEVKSGGQVFTYVGGGEDSPNVIEFMGGKQRFVRGKATEVTDPEVLRKVLGNPTFIEGEVDEEDLHEYDQTAKQEADTQRLKDKALNAAYIKKHRTE